MHSYQRYVKQPEKKSLVFIAAVVIGNKGKGREKEDGTESHRRHKNNGTGGKTGYFEGFLKNPPAGAS